MNKIIVMHGPNLNLLGKRETGIYGQTTLGQINQQIKALADEKKVSVEFFQSNHEGDIVDKIAQSNEEKVSAILLNPAAYTHTSVAIRDAIAACAIPVVEVHLSNIYQREEFRHQSLIAPVAAGQISGFGAYSYILGFLAAVQLIQKK